MEIGVGMPNMNAHVGRDVILEWCTTAESLGFSSLSTGERLTYANNDPIVQLSMAAAVTERIRIMTSVVVLPLHTTAVVAKQAATMDHLTNGRFVFAVGSGGHVGDYDAAPVPWNRRIGRYEQQLIELRRLWNGDPIGPSGMALGPQPPSGRPKLLIGPSTPRAAERAYLADGILTFMWANDPGPQRALYDVAARSWAEHSRAGKPAFIAGLFFALGPDGHEKGILHLSNYYKSFGEEAITDLLKSVRTLSEADISTAIERFDAAGVDELILCPLVPEVDQLRRLRDLIA